MQITLRHAALFAGLSSATILWPESARADDFEACISAYENAQVHRRAGALVTARNELIVCAQASCPSSARRDCTTWLTEVDAALPSIVIAARDAQGRELHRVRVIVDGKLLTETLDGKAIPIDPGARTFRFEHAGMQSVEQRLTVREGEKSRPLSVRLAPLTPSETTEMPDRAERPTPVLVYALGGVGVAALATSGVFGWLAYSKERDLRDQDCVPNCSAGDVDRIERQRRISDIALGVGAVALAGAAVLYFTRPSETKTRGRVFVRPTPGGVTGGLDFSHAW